MFCYTFEIVVQKITNYLLCLCLLKPKLIDESDILSCLILKNHENHLKFKTLNSDLDYAINVLREADCNEEYRQQNKESKCSWIWKKNDNNIFYHAEQLRQAILHPKNRASLSFRDRKLHHLNDGQIAQP